MYNTACQWRPGPHGFHTFRLHCKARTEAEETVDYRAWLPQ